MNQDLKAKQEAAWLMKAEKNYINIVNQINNSFVRETEMNQSQSIQKVAWLDARKGNKKK